MARKHYANALVARNNVPFDEWMEVMRAQNEGAVPRDHVHRIAKTVLRKCDPNQYLLSHATIVASVDTYAPKGVKLGTQLNKGVQIDVRYPDFRIDPKCTEIINNNGDAWSRGLLLSTYRTFIGAQNYLEHVQIPELSKGFIVDAIARDLGSTCYIDILVATDRKHGILVNDILSGTMQALSMGCISAFTVCTKCGNVASDDSQLCPCIQYEGKHTLFTDEDGQQHKIAELIGHVSVPNSNQFIDASWVKNPAFRGAVRRNFLNDDPNKVAALIDNAKTIADTRTVVQVDGMKKAASLIKFAADDDLGGLLAGLGGGDEPAGDAPPEEEAKSEAEGSGAEDEGASEAKKEKNGKNGEDSKIDSLLNKVQEQLLSIMVDKLGEKLKPKPEDVATVMPAPKDLLQSADGMQRGASFRSKVAAIFPRNPGMVRWASKAYEIVHNGGIPAIHKVGMKADDLIVLSWIEDLANGRRHPVELYRLSMKLGPMRGYPTEKAYLAAASLKAGRSLTESEKSFLASKGRIASFGVQ